MMFFDIVPIILATIAIILASLKVKVIRRRTDFVICVLSVLSGLLLIVAQSSWWIEYTIENNVLGTSFSNATWLLFNSMVMSIIILNNLPRNKK